MNSNDEGWHGETSGREVYMSSVESTVLGPDGEPVRKSYRSPIGFRLTPSNKKTARSGPDLMFSHRRR